MGKCIDSSLLLVLVNPRQVHYGSQFGVHFSVAPHEPALSKGDLISWQDMFEDLSLLAHETWGVVSSYPSWPRLQPMAGHHIDLTKLRHKEVMCICRSLSSAYAKPIPRTFDVLAAFTVLPSGLSSRLRSYGLHGLPDLCTLLLTTTGHQSDKKSCLFNWLHFSTSFSFSAFWRK